jgi:beta-N-acetylhexosaminidase
LTTLPLGQLFVFGFQGNTLSNQAKKLLSEYDASGVILFARNIEDMRQLVDLNSSIMNGVQAHAPIISVDQEGGRVARLRDICTPVPAMRIIGDLAKKDLNLPYRLGAMMGRELCALGFNLDFAPVLDVDTNPHNPVIGDRAFSTLAEEVATIGARFIEGMQGAGLAACGKHFPGHGDTLLDSHIALPTVEHDLLRLENVELVPFKAAVHANVASMMTAHVLMPKLDALYPATLSKTILDGILRKRLNYQGLVISDDLEMLAVADHYSLKEMLRLGLNAGIDLFLICKEEDKCRMAIEFVGELLSEGAVEEARIHEALSRVQAMKQTYIGTPAAPEYNDAKTIVRSAPHMSLALAWQQRDVETQF